MPALDTLFPIQASLIVKGFTTSSAQAVTIPNIVTVNLSDKSLGVHKISSQTTHAVVNIQDTQAWEAIYHKGSTNPGNKESPHGGFGFYLRGPAEFAHKLRNGNAMEVLMSYQVMFEEGWEWRKGGKLPGIYGGVGDSAYGCTGGRQADRCKCFNLRLMWRENGIGELYAYLPLTHSNKARLMAVPPKSIQHPDYGFSVGRGAWKFESGKWTTVAQRVKMNNVGLEDDEDASDSHVQGLHFQTFFGGHSPDWASPKDQKAWFANISGAILHSSQERPREEL